MARTVLDATGKLVPLHLRKTHANSARLARAATLLAQAARVVETLRIVPGGEWLPEKEVLQGMSVIKQALLSARYLTACPKCDAHGCEGCRKRGWIPIAHRNRVEKAT